VAITAVVFTLFIAFKVIGAIKERLEKISIVVRQIGTGDLRDQVNLHVDDEFGAMAREINNMTDQFRSIISQLNNASERLAVSASQCAMVCRESVSDIQKQHHMSLSLASGMTRMSSAIDNVSRGSNETLARVEQVRGATQKGISSMQQHIGKVHNIANNIERAANNVEQLSSLSNTIGSVLDVIRGISEQTNLLALNAAIEAARAGEQGRGFAVVADEVRTLASRTGNSTTEIQQMIEKLQASTNDAVRDMVLSREDAKSGVEDVALVGDLLKNLSESVEGIHVMNADMANSAEAQSQVTKEFDLSIRQMTLRKRSPNHTLSPQSVLI
jgi:methyl-accepting chemotaxis protein